MGNQLVGIAPSQIYPVEHYLSGTFEPELQFEANMGSTRFFKVARVKSEEGPVVVKVFVKHDPSLPLENYSERLEYIKKTLSSAMNCLPFQRVLLSDKAGYLMREYVKHSLYDRVSTRPFLTILEKKWITFQILCALNQCHKQRVCHGDIKLENILITSWNWILLADFASFKPTYLPEDNPADYAYFFDTSRRRTCYIAPERFVKTLSSEAVQAGDDIPLLTESTLSTESLVRIGPYEPGSLLPEMDIFSAGCALLELWTEGTAPFEFSQLLSYRRGDKDLVSKHLQGIENDHLRNLISSMLSRNPKERKSAEIYLDQEKGRLFPEYFYSFLQSYLQMLYYSPTALIPDERIKRLHTDISHCIKVLTEDKNVCDNERHVESNNSRNVDSDGLILIITVVTSCIRGIKYSDSKICCLDILQTLAEYTTADTVLDRILPHILHLTQDLSPRVQVQAMDTLTTCLNMIKVVPRSDVNIFPEYILPSIAGLSTHNSIIVRVCYARNITKIAKTAVYFLEETQRISPYDMPSRRYEAELNALHEIIQQTVSSLLTDSQPLVKQTLIESGIFDLCSFFGKKKANDVILSHMITFLNDKEDKNLRGSFFDCIVGVVGYIGWQASDILIPLLQQGLTDSEELVIAKAIRATTALIDMGHIQKPIVTEFIAECACYLVHPNLWIRHEIVGLISTTARKLSTIDVQCKIIPAIVNHLKSNVIQVERIEILLDCLNPPIPRNIFDSVLKYSEINKLIKALEDRKDMRSKISPGSLLQFGEMESSLKNLFRRLDSEGLNEFIELQLLSMEVFLLKLSKYKGQEPKNFRNGKIVLSKRSYTFFKYPLAEKGPKDDENKNKFRGIDCENMSNVEWQHLLGSDAQRSHVISSPSSTESVSLAACDSSNNNSLLQPTPMSFLGEYSMPEKSFWHERSSVYQSDLEKLRHKLRSRYAVLASNREFNASICVSTTTSGFKMNGTLIAHLHEHTSSIMKLALLRSHSSLFASGSLDGTVRLWDCNKLNGSQSINKSRQAYSTNNAISSLASCDLGQTLAVGCEDGALLLLRIDRNSNKMTLQQAFRSNATSKTDPDEGAIVDMQSFEQNSNIIVYVTLYGSIIALDTRTQSIAWRLQNDIRNGITNSLCIDPTGSWLATGSSGGKHICWDLRFRLPIAEIRHPSDAWIKKVICHPTEPSCLIAATNNNNEVSFWNIETGHRQTVLWASAAPALSMTSVNNQHFNRALLAGITDKTPFLLTGSTDQRIRYWDLNTPKKCCMVVPSIKDNLSEQSFTYDSRLIDGSRVIEETVINFGSAESFANRSTEEQPRSGPDMPCASHIDGITDLLMCKTEKQQNVVVSSSRDGVIKIWK